MYELVLTRYSFLMLLFIHDGVVLFDERRSIDRELLAGFWNDSRDDVR